MFVDRGTFWVRLVTYFCLPKNARAYLFSPICQIRYFCSGPISVDPISPQPNEGNTTVFRTQILHVYGFDSVGILSRKGEVPPTYRQLPRKFVPTDLSAPGAQGPQGALVPPDPCNIMRICIIIATIIILTITYIYIYIERERDIHIYIYIYIHIHTHIYIHIHIYAHACMHAYTYIYIYIYIYICIYDIVVGTREVHKVPLFLQSLATYFGFPLLYAYIIHTTSIYPSLSLSLSLSLSIIHIYIYIYTYIHAYMCVCVCISLSLSIYIYIWVYIHIYIYIRRYDIYIYMARKVHKVPWLLQILSQQLTSMCLDPFLHSNKSLKFCKHNFIV